MSKMESIRGEMIFDYVQKLELADRVDAEYFKALAQSHLAKNKFNEAALIIHRFKFVQEFDIINILNRLVDSNRMATAKLMCELDMVFTHHLITILSTNENSKVAA